MHYLDSNVLQFHAKPTSWKAMPSALKSAAYVSVTRILRAVDHKLISLLSHALNEVRAC